MIQFPLRHLKVLFKKTIMKKIPVVEEIDNAEEIDEANNDIIKIGKDDDKIVVIDKSSYIQLKQLDVINQDQIDFTINKDQIDDIVAALQKFK
jgi:intein/homing endonuclease